MQEYFISALILLGFTGCGISCLNYKLIVEDKILETFETKEKCEKRAKKLNIMAKAMDFDRKASYEISFFKYGLSQLEMK